MVRRGMAAALCAAALLLSGCSDDPPEPKPLDPPTGSETTTAPPTSEPPKAQTPEQTIRKWIAETFQMQRTGETEAALALTHSCGPCEEFADQVEQVYADGGSAKPGRERILSMKKVQQLPDGGRIYRVSTRTPPWSVIRKAGGKVEKHPGGRTDLKFELRQQGGEWLISNYTVLV